MFFGFTITTPESQQRGSLLISIPWLTNPGFAARQIYITCITLVHTPTNLMKYEAWNGAGEP